MNLNRLILLFLSVAITTSCGVYSFTGASLSPEIKTISIQNFYNDSGGGPPDLSQLFTEKTKDYFQQNTNLTLVDQQGDIQLEGSIVKYEFSPVAPTASNRPNQPSIASQTRLTITVNATYVNLYDEQFNFEDKRFSFFLEFDSNTPPSSVEDGLIDEITDQIILDIFNSSVATW